MPGARSADVTAPLRVVIVDDVDDVRAVLRLQFRLDERFEVVGEGADGYQAIDLARDLQPDLLVLDRNMPRLGGLEAIPQVRDVAPATAIVLYTAAADKALFHDALTAGALDVLEKAAASDDFVERFTQKLLDRAGHDDNALEVRVGPVTGSAARTWIANSKSICQAVAAHADMLDVSKETLDLFLTLLDEWQEVAQDADEFLWVARASAEDVTGIINQWAVIDGMTDEQIEELGVHWSPPEGQPFFEALTTGVLRALERQEETKRLAEHLEQQWAPWRQGGEFVDR